SLVGCAGGGSARRTQRGTLTASGATGADPGEVFSSSFHLGAATPVRAAIFAHRIARSTPSAWRPTPLEETPRPRCRDRPRPVVRRPRTTVVGRGEDPPCDGARRSGRRARRRPRRPHRRVRPRPGRPAGGRPRGGPAGRRPGEDRGAG